MRQQCCLPQSKGSRSFIGVRKIRREIRASTQTHPTYWVTLEESYQGTESHVYMNDDQRGTHNQRHRFETLVHQHGVDFGHDDCMQSCRVSTDTRTHYGRHSSLVHSDVELLPLCLFDHNTAFRRYPYSYKRLILEEPQHAATPRLLAIAAPL